MNVFTRAPHPTPQYANTKKLSLSLHNSHFHIQTATCVSKWDFFVRNDSVMETTVPRVSTASQLWTLFSSKQQFPSSQGKPTSLHTIWQCHFTLRTTSYKTWTDSAYHQLPEPHGCLSNPQKHSAMSEGVRWPISTEGQWPLGCELIATVGDTGQVTQNLQWLIRLNSIILL